MKTLSDPKKWASMARSVALAAIGAGGAVLLSELASLDWDVWSPIATAVISVAANALRKFGFDQ